MPQAEEHDEYGGSLLPRYPFVLTIRCMPKMESTLSGSASTWIHIYVYARTPPDGPRSYSSSKYSAFPNVPYRLSFSTSISPTTF